MLPSLIEIKDGNAIINKDFLEVNDKDFSPQRGIEVFYEKIKNTLYQEKLENQKVSQGYIENKMQYFNMAYGTVKRLFQDIERNNGYRYFNHLIGVLNLILDKSNNPTLLKVLISLNHDNLEDTDITYNTLKELYGDKMALGVLLISKKPFSEYVENNIEDKKIIDSIYESGILNDKLLLSDKFLRYKKYNPNELTQEQLEKEKFFTNLCKKYKEVRNQDYFSHMINFETFYENALTLRQKYKIRLTDEEIKELCLETLLLSTEKNKLKNNPRYWDYFLA